MFQVSQFGESCATHLLTTMRFREKLAQNGQRFTVFLCPLFVRVHLFQAVEMGAPDLGTMRQSLARASKLTESGRQAARTFPSPTRRPLGWSGSRIRDRFAGTRIEKPNASPSRVRRSHPQPVTSRIGEQDRGIRRIRLDLLAQPVDSRTPGKPSWHCAVVPPTSNCCPPPGTASSIAR